MTKTSKHSNPIPTATRRDWLRRSAAIAAASSLPTWARAAGYPERAITFICTWPAGGTADQTDMGATTLLVPMIDTPAQAAAMVAATRYPPQGLRGVGAAAARASQWNGHTGYVRHANDGICLLVQAETLAAIGNLEAICAIDGVDGGLHRPRRPGRVDGPARQPVAPRGAGDHRARHRAHRCERQGRKAR